VVSRQRIAAFARIDGFVDGTDFAALGFDGVERASTGRSSIIRLKPYIYSYLNCEQSSHRLEREASRNVELMWLLSKQTLMEPGRGFANPPMGAVAVPNPTKPGIVAAS